MGEGKIQFVGSHLGYNRTTHIKDTDIGIDIGDIRLVQMTEDIGLIRSA